MDKLTYHRYLISRFYPTCENFVHVKITWFTVNVTYYIQKIRPDKQQRKLVVVDFLIIVASSSIAELCHCSVF